MLEFINLEGFKAINKQKEFPLAPINLFIGKNGAGKSSVINALFNTRSLLEKSANDADFLAMMKNPLSPLGYFEQNIINRNNKSKRFKIELPFILDKFETKERGTSFSILLEYKICKTNWAELYSFTILRNHDRFEIYKVQESGDGYELTLNLDFIIKRAYELASTAKPKEEINFQELFRQGEIRPTRPEDVFGDTEKHKTPFDKQNFCPLVTPNNCSSLPSLEDLARRLKKAWDQNFFFYKNLDGSDIDSSIYKNLESVIEDFENSICKKKYNYKMLGERLSSRLNAETFHLDRVIDQSKIDLFNITISNFTEKHKLIFNEFFWESFRNGIDSLCRTIRDLEYISPNRFKGYTESNSILDEFRNATIIDLQNIRNDHSKTEIIGDVQYWLNQFEIKVDKPIKDIDDLIALIHPADPTLNGNPAKSKATDMGFGINQLIPLIVRLPLFKLAYNFENETKDDYYPDMEVINRYTAKTNKTFLIEEPEANLHPNFQSKLADLFIDYSWKFGHQFIIETHSEYLVRKFQYWVAKGKIKPEDVNIFYFDNQNHNPKIKDVEVRKINIRKDGSLTDSFGSGFFDEANRIALELFYHNRGKTN